MQNIEMIFKSIKEQIAITEEMANLKSQTRIEGRVWCVRDLERCTRDQAENFFKELTRDILADCARLAPGKITVEFSQDIPENEHLNLWRYIVHSEPLD